jgi:hypothetical protein
MLDLAKIERYNLPVVRRLAIRSAAPACVSACCSAEEEERK